MVLRDYIVVSRTSSRLVLDLDVFVIVTIINALFLKVLKFRFQQMSPCKLHKRLSVGGVVMFHAGRVLRSFVLDFNISLR